MVYTASHISARMAWHTDGWNGHICKNPKANSYCIGQHSYAGEMILEDRDIDWEQKKDVAGCPCSKLDKTPPCVYSINAFGKENLRAYSTPPLWFKGKRTKKYWEIGPATTCIWPYEEMYKEDVKYTPENRPPGSKQIYNYKKRLEEAKNYFSELEPEKSLIFYYANYSNPFSEDECKKYVIVGMSRLNKLGQYHYYDDVTEEDKAKYANGFVWQMAITSKYPDEGFRIPYHLYMDKPDILEKILFVPDNNRSFKYASRHISDDDALALIEKFIEIVDNLIEIGDESENWQIRKSWLQSLIGELWKNRGAYPGLSNVLKVIGFYQAIPFFKDQCNIGKDKETKELIFKLLDNKVDSIDGLKLSYSELKTIKRSWFVRLNTEKKLLSEVLPLFDLREDQIKKILSLDRQTNGLQSSLQEIIDDPYVICEQFVGDNIDDSITFNKIDHGMIPSPELGLANFVEKDDWRRFRALVVERLKREDRHTFLPITYILNDINKWLNKLPDWKSHQFNENYFNVDQEELSRALVFREIDDNKYVYLKKVFEDEKLIGDQIMNLARRKNISLNAPVTDNNWRTFLYDSDSPLAVKIPKEYEKAINGQLDVCKKILDKPVCVISGEAGTGKTTVIKALIHAIEKTSGRGVSIKLLAPTGKAADRIREKTKGDANTIHSFLAFNGWLNDNMTFKRAGGQIETGFRVYIIDESSMLDLELVATLFRSINWNFVQRLIFVGDPNQLPPIGRGRVFADIIDWLQENSPESIAMLKSNIRQMENRLTDHGTGILDMASLFVTKTVSEENASNKKADIEMMLQRLQHEGDIDNDLRVEYWKTQEELEEKIVDNIIHDLESETGEKFDEEKPYDLLNCAIKDENGVKRTDHDMIISPYRGEFFGTENINLFIQNVFNAHNVERKGVIGGITLFDKVIQVVNRGKSRPLFYYDFNLCKKAPIEVYNGELGYVKPHNFDLKNWKYKDFRIERFQVEFARKPGKHVEYSNSDIESNLELAYAISVHKAQGSEFDHLYFILPKNKKSLLSTELLYTGITRAKKHLTLFIEGDSSPILSMSQSSSSQLNRINSSIFTFKPIPNELLLPGWYEDKKVYKTLTRYMVRSKSEVIITNMLFDRNIPFRYEEPLFANDGSLYLPDFTVTWEGEDWYWEHLGLLNKPEYLKDWNKKEEWYNKNFPGKLVTTKESVNISEDAKNIIDKYFSY